MYLFIFVFKSISSRCDRNNMQEMDCRVYYSRVSPPLLPGRVQERHRGHPDDVLLRLQQRVLEVFLLQVMELDSWILPGEIHKLLSLEYSINFVNEEDPGDVNINLNSYFVIDILIQWRGVFVLQMCSLVMCDDHIY